MVENMHIYGSSRLMHSGILEMFAYPHCDTARDASRAHLLLYQYKCQQSKT